MVVESAVRENLPAGLKKEILILYNLGVEEYDIEYIIQQRIKKKFSEKWDN